MLGVAMRSPRFKFRDTTVSLSNGGILVAGGARNAELLGSGAPAFRNVPGDFGSDLSFAASTPLADGGALIAGGYDEHGRKSAGVWRFYR